MLTIFNFSPAVQDLNQEFNDQVDLLVVNEIEVAIYQCLATDTLKWLKYFCVQRLKSSLDFK